DAPERLHGTPHQTPAIVRTREVAAVELTASARFHDEAFRLVRVLVLALIQIRNRHIGALTRKSDGYGASDARITPGDQSLLSLQPPGAAIRVLAVIGFRIHRRSPSGCGLPLWLERRSG